MLSSNSKGSWQSWLCRGPLCLLAWLAALLTVLAAPRLMNCTIHSSLAGSTPVSVEVGGASNLMPQNSFVASVEKGAGRHDVVADAGPLDASAESRSINNQLTEADWMRRALKGFSMLSMGSSRQDNKLVEMGGGRIASTVKTVLHKLLVMAFGGQEAGTQDEAGVAFREGILRFASDLQTTVDGHMIPAETRAKGCVELMLTMFVAMLASPRNTVAIEYGTMMGYSTRCLAAGARMALLAGAHAGDESFFAFDIFNYCPRQKPTWKNSNMAGKEAWLLQGDNYRQQVQHHVLPYSVILTKGMLGTTAEGSAPAGSPWFWGGRAANMVSIDGGKDRPFWNTVTTLFMSSVGIGSLILAGDSMAKHGVMCVQIGTILGALVRGGYVDLVHTADRETFTTWVVLKEIPGNLITNFKFGTVTARQWDSLWDSFEQQRMAILKQVYGAPDMSVEAEVQAGLREARACCKR